MCNLDLKECKIRITLIARSMKETFFDISIIISVKLSSHKSFCVSVSPQVTLTFTNSLVNAASRSGCLETRAVMWWLWQQTLQIRCLNRSVRISTAAESIMWIKPAHPPIPPAFTTVCTKMVVCRTAHRAWEVTAQWLPELLVVRFSLV